MQLNEAKIPHYRSSIVPTEKLKKIILLNEKYLKEKPTWYCIDDTLQYFKVRNDFRLFTEQFSSIFCKQIMDLDALDYKVAYVRTIDPVLKSTEEITKCGLLSENFQEKGFNYYLVSELFNSEISNLRSFGDYSLKTLLEFFKTCLTKENCKENTEFLIKLFICDAFLHQEDRNPHNISFKAPQIKEIPYQKRLQPEYLKRQIEEGKHYIIAKDGRTLLTDLSPTKVYDNERILGTDHKNVFTYEPGQIWRPLFPYSEDTLFKSEEEAQIATEIYDGLDPNLYELYENYPEISKPYIERLAYGDDYKKILENFKGKSEQINLSTSSEERLTTIFKDKQKVFKRTIEG